MERTTGQGPRPASNDLRAGDGRGPLLFRKRGVMTCVGRWLQKDEILGQEWVVTCTVCGVSTQSLYGCVNRECSNYTGLLMSNHDKPCTSGSAPEDKNSEQPACYSTQSGRFCRGRTLPAAQNRPDFASILKGIGGCTSKSVTGTSVTVPTR